VKKMDQMLPFFALLGTADEPRVALIVLSQSVQHDLTELFAEQRTKFLSDAKLVAWDPGYEPSPGEDLFIEPFEPPAAVTNALTNPAGQERLSFDVEILKEIRGIITGVWTSKEHWLSAQVFDRRRLLSPTSFSLLHEHGTFVRLQEPGLTLDWQLAAAVDAGRLVFHSFNVVRRLFNMMAYFAEATDQQVRDLATHHAVLVEDVDTFVRDADTWTRKKIALIERSEILDTQRPRQVAKVASEYGLQLTIAKVDGKDKISIPPEKKEMKAVLQFLDEDYFTSSLTHTQFVTNSKRKLAVKA